MSAHERAMEKKKAHKHRKGEDGKCEVCNMSMKGSKDLDDKGKKPAKPYSFSKIQGAKNNDSQD